MHLQSIDCFLQNVKQVHLTKSKHSCHYLMVNQCVMLTLNISPLTFEDRADVLLNQGYHQIEVLLALSRDVVSVLCRIVSPENIDKVENRVLSFSLLQSYSY